MGYSEFIESHAGKAVIGITAAAFLLAWPPAFPWVAAAALLRFGVRHLVLAFKEAERESLAQTPVQSGAPPLAAPVGERRLDGPRHSAVPARSPLDGA